MLPRNKTVRRSAHLSNSELYDARASARYVVRTTCSRFALRCENNQQLLFAACLLKMPAAAVSAECECLMYSYRCVGNAFSYNKTLLPIRGV